jgi:WD40 repeat protein
MNKAKKPLKRNRKSRFILLPLLLLIGILAYFQFWYQPTTVDKGLIKLHKTYNDHHHEVMAIRFSPNDSLIISGSVDSTIKIRNLATGKTVRTINHPGSITYLDISNDGKFIVTGSYDSIVRIWNANNGKLVRKFKGHTGTIWTVAFSPDNKWIASSGDDKMIRLWDIASGNLIHTLNGHKRIVWSVKFSPDGTKLASCSFDGTFRLWDLATGNLIRNNQEHTQAIVDIAFSNNGKLIASTSDDKTIRLWNANNGALVRTMEVPEHVQAVVISPDDKLLMTGGRDKTTIGELIQNFAGNSHFNKGVSARLWDIETGNLLQTFSHHSNDVNDIAYSHNGKWIATASADKSIDLWRIQ